MCERARVMCDVRAFACVLVHSHSRARACWQMGGHLESLAVGDHVLVRGAKKKDDENKAEGSSFPA